MTTCQRQVAARSLRVSRAFPLGANAVAALAVARFRGGEAAENPEIVPARMSIARASGSTIRLSFTRDDLLWGVRCRSGSPGSTSRGRHGCVLRGPGFTLLGRNR